MNISELQKRTNEIAAMRYHAKAKLTAYAQRHIGEFESSREWLELLSDHKRLHDEWRSRTRLFWAEKRRQEKEARESLSYEPD
ncbi:hypothetical protein [Maricaulis sp.]|uniref:hypothetical protein n=1 Tax=Maricaulis sp. TaxID=1486257 RepID=UPI003A92662C